MRKSVWFKHNPPFPPFFFPSHVLFRPRSRGALHPVSVGPQTPGGDDHPVQLQPRLHPAGRRHHHLLRSRAGDPRVDVSTPPLRLWVSDRRVFTVSRGRKEHKTPEFSCFFIYFTTTQWKALSSIKLLGVLKGSCGLLVICQPPFWVQKPVIIIDSCTWQLNWRWEARSPWLCDLTWVGLCDIFCKR